METIEELNKKSEAVKENYKKQVLKIKSSKSKDKIKKQELDKAAEQYLEQNKEIYRKKLKIWKEQHEIKSNT